MAKRRAVIIAITITSSTIYDVTWRVHSNESYRQGTMIPPNGHAELVSNGTFFAVKRRKPQDFSVDSLYRTKYKKSGKDCTISECKALGIHQYFANEGGDECLIWCPYLDCHSRNNTHWSRDKMVAIFPTIVWNAWMKMYKFQLRFHWSLFLGVQLTIFRYWFWLWLGCVYNW